VLSPDGHTLAFARYREREARRPHRGEVTIFRSASIWLLDITSGALKQLTPWRNGLLEYPSSFSPDGSTLAVTRDRRLRPHRFRVEAAAVRLDGSGSTVLARNAGELVYSPGGASWDPSGQRLAYTQIPLGGGEAHFLGIGDSIMEINADGTCPTKILSYPRVILYGATWQPGPGREAGPIFC
jgi:Tol biopolymer transport system component